MREGKPERWGLLSRDGKAKPRTWSLAFRGLILWGLHLPFSVPFALLMRQRCSQVRGHWTMNCRLCPRMVQALVHLGQCPCAGPTWPRPGGWEQNVIRQISYVKTEMKAPLHCLVNSPKCIVSLIITLQAFSTLTCYFFFQIFMYHTNSSIFSTTEND